ncbi:hypothetical protein [Geminicoccus roseus]|uniref:hypothetical protein n=1 Tax=Geminicoccus roseus TaxID=404900 RepID=UPI00042872F0|nr:hypothetical protein [Geminicoccus roseus]
MTERGVRPADQAEAQPIEAARKSLVNARRRGWSVILVGGQPVITAPLRSLDLDLLDRLMGAVDAVTDLLEEEAEPGLRPVPSHR